MKAALETLGIETWHWVTQAENPADMAMWVEALKAKFEPSSGLQPFARREFDSLLGHCAACTDQPAVLFAEELVKAYPEAKVILVERDIDTWLKSYSQTVISGSANPFVPLMSLLDPAWMGQMSKQTDLVARHYFHVTHPNGTGAFFGKKHFFEQWRANAESSYLAHNETVKRVTPPDRLLLFSLADGWEPLCQFLGKPIPDVPFPIVNETLAVQEKINLYILESYKRTLIRFAKRAATITVALSAVLLFWRWQ